MRPETIRRVCRALARAYGNPRLGNKSNPLDELVYIILSTRAQDQAFRLTFTKLKASFPSWNAVRVRNRGRVERILRPAGLSKLKARHLYAISSICYIVLDVLPWPQFADCPRARRRLS